jgi:hypothetical protein
MGFNIKYLIVFFLICTGCLKKPAELSIDDGVPADIAAIEDALASGFGDIDPLQMKQDEFVAAAQTQQIFDLPLRVAFQVGNSIYKRKTHPDRVDFTILQQLVEYDANQNQKSSVSQRELSVVTGLLQANSISEQSLSLFFQRSSQHPSIRFCRSLFDPAANSTDILAQARSRNVIAQKVKTNLNRAYSDRSSPISLESFCSVALACEFVGECFNFETFESYERPPKYVAESPNCQNIPNCLMKVVTTKFAFVFTDTDSEGNELRNKILYEVRLSPDVPYLARLLSQCRQGIVPIDSATKVYAKICDQVTDFEQGTTEPQ